MIKYYLESLICCRGGMVLNNPPLRRILWRDIIRKYLFSKSGRKAVSDIFAKVTFFIPLDFIVGVVIFRLSLEQFVGVSIVGGIISTALTPLFGRYIDACRRFVGVR